MPVDELRQIPVFAELPAATLERLRAVIEEQQYADGVQVFAEGDEGNSVYFIRDGRARVEKLVQTGATGTKTLSIMSPGEFFGEMSLFDGKPRSASTLAFGPLRVYRITRPAFQALLEQDHAAAAALLFAIIRTCHQRIRSLSSKVVVFHEVGKAIGEATSLEQLAEVVLGQLREGTGASSGILAVKLEFFDRLEIVSSFGRTLPQPVRDAIGGREGILDRVTQERRGILIEDFDASPPAGARVGYETASLIAEPVIVRDLLLGVLVLGHELPGRFGLNELNLCASVAGQVAQAILNFRHRDEEQRRTQLGRQYVRF